MTEELPSRDPETEAADATDAITRELRFLIEEVERHGDYDSQFGIGAAIDRAWKIVGEDAKPPSVAPHRYPPFPDHAGSLELQHNDFKSDYSTAEAWISYVDENGEDGGMAVPEWETPEHRQRAIDTNEVWTLHWYPHTPVGFYYVAAPTFEELLKFANSYE